METVMWCDNMSHSSLSHNMHIYCTHLYAGRASPHSGSDSDSDSDNDINTDNTNTTAR
ncbi:predicted protein [Plenodomus lingam JN3]|uniref:Predicted protein n=1 Tax=Leptosphaeria maculans (strain JN3 / isolate v23.1.3 / race Av1-4-5-6-7-8) TaxID=985895 RepID=E4ZHJ8_LEPMJ|nr:predicted protein [Plenodomus lingam JN3]CBX90831.1 predicted protein [Plenodomus lingam JN3]